jgi:hypothetical protein
MNKRQFLIAAAVFVFLTAFTVNAQVDSGNRLYLYENDVRVGEVYVPLYVPGQTSYTQHWVLYPGYLYPGPKFIGALQVIPSPTERPYASETDFFQNVPWSAGSKYIRITSEEFTSLPVRR